MAQSHGDLGPAQAPPPADLATARALGRRIALVAQDYVVGRRARAELELDAVCAVPGVTASA